MQFAIITIVSCSSQCLALIHCTSIYIYVHIYSQGLSGNTTPYYCLQLLVLASALAPIPIPVVRFAAQITGWPRHATRHYADDLSTSLPSLASPRSYADVVRLSWYISLPSSYTRVCLYL